MAKSKFQFPIGKRVLGYGMLNEYGEIVFEPTKVGSREGVIRIVKSNDDYTLSTSKKKVIIHCSLKKQNGLPLLNDFLRNVNAILQDLRTYDF